MRLAEANQKRRPLCIGRLALLRRQSTLEVGDRFLVGVGGHALLACEACVVHQLVRAQDRLGFGEVMHELARVGLRLRTVDVLEHPGDLGMQPDSAGDG